MLKPGSHPRQMWRSRLREFLTGMDARTRMEGIGILVLAAGGPLLLAQVLGHDTPALLWWFSGFSVGVLVTLSLGLFALASGASAPMLGEMGEKATAEWLKQRPNTKPFHGLLFGTDGDTDHIAVSRSGIFVVESKFTSQRWTVENGTLFKNGFQDRDHTIQKLLQRTRRVRLLLNQVGVGEVHPVLVVWGPEPEGIGPFLVEGVQVVFGRTPGSAGAIRGSIVSDEVRERAIEVLSAQAKRQAEPPED